jgi:hypothetical protein
MITGPWRAVLTSAQRRSSYIVFVSAFALQTWLVFRNMPPTDDVYWVGPLWSLSQIPFVVALASTVVCALLLWPPLVVLWGGPRSLAPFFRGALIGAAVFLASALVAHFGYFTYTAATTPNSGWAFILVPLYFASYAALPLAWMVALASAVIGGFAFAFSEATG